MKVNVSELIDRAPVRGFQWLVVALCGLVALMDGFDIQTMAFVTPSLAAEWNLPKSAFGPVLSASFAGIMVGTMALGLLGDRFGRRRTLIWSFLFVGFASIATAWASSPEELMLLRFLTGAGIGGCLPNATALTAEYVPARRVGLFVTLMYSAVPLGGVLGGFVAGDVIARFGWGAVFVAGGVLPLAIGAALWAWLPESPRFLAVRPGAEVALGRILERIDPGYRHRLNHSFVVDGGAAKGSLAGLFADGRAALTAVIWIVFFFGLFGMYLLTSWLPTVFTEAGWPMAKAIRTVSLFQMGGVVGGLIAGRLVDRYGPYAVLGPLFALAAVATFAVGAVTGPALQTLTLVAVAGFGVVGAQLGMTALAASVYPTNVRSTGVGWALGVGRFGAVVSPTLGGYAITAGWSQPALFLCAAIPSAICCAAVLALWAYEARRPAQAAA